MQLVEPAQLASGAVAAVLHHIAAGSAGALAGHVHVIAPVHDTIKQMSGTLDPHPSVMLMLCTTIKSLATRTSTLSSLT